MADSPLSALVEGYQQGQALQMQKAREITDRKLKQSQLDMENQRARQQLIQQNFENHLATLASNRANETLDLNKQKASDATEIANKKILELAKYRTARLAQIDFKNELAKAKSQEDKVKARMNLTARLVNSGWFSTQEAAKHTAWIEKMSQAGVDIPSEPQYTPEGKAIFPLMEEGGAGATEAPTTETPAAIGQPTAGGAGVAEPVTPFAPNYPAAGEAPALPAMPGLNINALANPPAAPPSAPISGIPYLSQFAAAAAPQAGAAQGQPQGTISPQQFNQQGGDLARLLGLADTISMPSAKAQAEMKAAQDKVSINQLREKEIQNRLNMFGTVKALKEAQTDLFKSLVGKNETQKKEILQKIQFDTAMNPLRESALRARIAQDNLVTEKMRNELDTLRKEEALGWDRSNQQLAQVQASFGNIVSNYSNRLEDKQKNLAQVLAEMSYASWPKDVHGQPLPGDQATDEVSPEDSAEVKDWKQSRLPGGRRFQQVQAYTRDIAEIKRIKSQFDNDLATIRKKRAALGQGPVETSAGGQPQPRRTPPSAPPSNPPSRRPAPQGTQPKVRTYNPRTGKFE